MQRSRVGKAKGPPEPAPSRPHRSPSQESKPSEQKQDQQDNHNKAEAAAAIIPGAVERSAADAAEAAEQSDNENDQDDSSDRHVTSPPAGSPHLLLCLRLKNEREPGKFQCPDGGYSVAPFFEMIRDYMHLGPRWNYEHVCTSDRFDSASSRPRRGDTTPQVRTGARGRRHSRVAGRRGEMGGQSHDLSGPRAGAGGVGPSRCRGRSRPAGSRAAVVAAAICRSSPGRDQESRPAAAGKTRLNQQQSISRCSNNAVKNSRLFIP